MRHSKRRDWLKLSHSAIVGLSNDEIEFTTDCDGTCSAKVANWRFSWGLRNGRIQVDRAGDTSNYPNRIPYEDAVKIMRDRIRTIWSGDIVGYH